MAVMTESAQRVAAGEPMAVMARSARRVTAQDAAALVRSGDWLDYGAVLAQPDAFDRALAERAGELRNVSIRGCLSLRRVLCSRRIRDVTTLTSSTGTWAAMTAS